MINELRIIHSKHNAQAIPSVSLPLWKTCLRSIYFGTVTDDISKNQEIYNGPDAYEFLLQIVCGLHSPMIGETEILSQFKDFITKNPFIMTPKVSNKLIQDAKKLRTEFLKGYGSQSYGSYTLKKSKMKKQILVIGAGALTNEILPIIKDFPGEITVKLRSLHKGEKIRDRFPRIKLEEINSGSTFTDALIVVAAPLKSHDLNNLITSQVATSATILDMRSIQDGPPLSLKESYNYQTLEQIFSEIEETQKILQLTAIKMKSEIRVLSKKWDTQIQFRPFGWEDLCC